MAESEYRTVITTKVPTEVTYFEQFELELTPGGMMVKVKSPIFATWVRRKENIVWDEDANMPVGPPSPSRLPARFLGSFPKGGFYQPSPYWTESSPYGIASFGCSQPFIESKINLIWLFHKDLEQGAEFLWKTPISLNNWEDYFTCCSRAIQDIWTKELRRLTLKASFSELVK